MERQPNTLVAAVALANGLNANMLLRWVRKAAASGGECESPCASASVLPRARICAGGGGNFRTYRHHCADLRATPDECAGADRADTGRAEHRHGDSTMR